MGTDFLYNFSPIGEIKSPFQEKFGVARQSMMMSHARGVLKLKDAPEYRIAAENLENFSHLWVIFVFHRHLDKKWRPKIMPPRVGGPDKVGVLASRSPHRPNPIGLSVLKIERIDLEAEGGAEIHLSGLDLLDGTPVLDIKPYLPYADCVPEATSGWAQGEIPKYPVSFSPKSLATIQAHTPSKHPRLKELLIQMVELDPRPTSQRRAAPIGSKKSEGRPFGFRLLGFNVRCEIRQNGIHILELEELNSAFPSLKSKTS